MEGRDTSRIDSIFAKEPAARSCTDISYLWNEGAGFDHVPIQATIQSTVFNDTITTLQKPVNIEIWAKPRGQKELRFKALWNQHYAELMDNYIANNDLTQSHRLWSKACEHFLLQTTLNRHHAALPDDKPRRGEPLPLVEVSVAATFDILQGRAETSYTARARAYLGQITDVRNRLKRWATHTNGTNDDADVDLVITINVDTNEVSNSKRMLKTADVNQMVQLLRKTRALHRHYHDCDIKPDYNSNYHLSSNTLGQAVRNTIEHIKQDASREQSC